MRDRTTMGFSIRLCGAPGAPTSNSVCGRSVMGKSFGVDAEQSWGWEVRERERAPASVVAAARGRALTLSSASLPFDSLSLSLSLSSPSVSAQSFVSVANLTERPWSSGDKLRFMINLDML
jgi:hypothetical protein